MKPSLLGSIVCASLGIGGLVGAVAAARESRVVPSGMNPDPELGRTMRSLTSDVERLGRRITDLEQELDDRDRVALDIGRRSPADAATADHEPGETRAPDAASSGSNGETGTAAPTDLEQDLEELVRAGLRDEAVESFFSKVSAAGQQEAAIAALERRIEQDPTDARNHWLLAKACYARLMLESSPAGFEEWGDRTVAAWDRAIELAPDYWEPRFERAEYFTYFPESEGKTPGLIVELESLIELQAGSTADPRYARTFAHLARMYLRIGKRDEAIRAASEGLALFQENEELRSLLGALKGG